MLHTFITENQSKVRRQQEDELREAEARIFGGEGGRLRRGCPASIPPQFLFI